MSALEGVDHKQCPKGSHSVGWSEETLTFTCAADGGVAVAKRCPGIAQTGQRCRVGLWTKDACKYHASRASHE